MIQELNLGTFEGGHEERTPDVEVTMSSAPAFNGNFLEMMEKQMKFNVSLAKKKVRNDPDDDYWSRVVTDFDHALKKHNASNAKDLISKCNLEALLRDRSDLFVSTLNGFPYVFMTWLLMY